MVIHLFLRILSETVIVPFDRVHSVQISEVPITLRFEFRLSMPIFHEIEMWLLGYQLLLIMYHEAIILLSEMEQGAISDLVIIIYLSERILNQIFPIPPPINSISETGSMETMEILGSVFHPHLLLQDSK